jgi:hypothetical protein
MPSENVYVKFSTLEEAKDYLKSQGFNPYISYSNPTRLRNVADPNAWYVIVTYWPAD